MKTLEAEEQLLIEAAQKDPSRFADLYEAHFGRVYAFVECRVRNRAQAEDITSEVFQKALAKLSTFEWRGAPFVSWLFRIAANAIVDHAQQQARERGAADAGDPVEHALPPDLDRIEGRARLFRLVNSLPTNQRRVVEMRFMEEKSIREIANEIGRSEGAVKQLQFRALENLRVQMGSKRGGAGG